MAIIFPVAVIAFAAFVGLSSTMCGVDDSPLEEATEEIVENQTESLLGLDDGSLNFDFTPSSVEGDDVAIVKADDGWLCRCSRSTQMNE